MRVRVLLLIMSTFKVRLFHLGLVVVVLLAGLQAFSASQRRYTLPFQDTFPPDYPTIDQLKFAELGGGNFNGDQLLGQAVMVIFFDPGCSKCTSKLPAIEKLRSMFDADGVVALGLSSSGGGLRNVSTRIGNKWRWITNSPGIKAKLQGKKSMEIFLFDPTGQIAYRFGTDGGSWEVQVQLGLAAVTNRALDLSGLPGDLSHEGFVGSLVCGMCHKEELAQWETTPHAHAYQTLVDSGDTDKVDCHSCHVTGEKGLEQRPWQMTPRELQEIGCESCHGPGGPHRREPHPWAATFSTAESSCVLCHDQENSPDFNYEEYLKKVVHK